MIKKQAVGTIVIALIILTCAMACSNGMSDNVQDNDRKDSGDAKGLTESDKTKFSAEDKLLGVLSISMSEQDVIAILGNPESKEIYINGGIYHYDDFSLSFFSHNPDYGFFLIHMKSETPGKEVIRGLSVGSTKEDVINAFYHAKHPEGYISIDTDMIANAQFEYIIGDAVSGKWLYGERLIMDDSLSGYSPLSFAEYGAIFSSADRTERIVYTSSEGLLYIYFNFGSDNRVTSIEWGCLVD